MTNETRGKTERVKCTGSCHCGRVKVSVKTSPDLKATRCNCSICRKSGHLHLTVAKDDLTVLGGEDHLTEYRFNSEIAQHLFCRHCGVKVFYVPRSHPDSYSVNVNCLDLDERFRVEIREFDGQNWEKNVAELRAWKD